jgi:glutathione synthase/RimK-type ligase-like ATP-grasp enzyme
MEKVYDVVILTDKRYINPDVTNNYTENVLLEDNLIKTAMVKKGLKVTRLSWDDPDFDWNTTKSILFRSTWDYFDRFKEFLAWLEKVSHKTLLINSEKIIRWNMDKHYLNDLEKKDIHTIPTLYIEKNSQTSLDQLHKKTSWKNTILKPCVSGAARHTYKLDYNDLEKNEAIFQDLIRNEAMMLQPFIQNIVDKGEISLIIIGGKYTHAVLKRAKQGDFRVQDDHGGTVHDYIPSEEEIKFAELAVKHCIEFPVYARVDIVNDNKGRLAVVELELIEPELWFRKKPDAATHLALAVKNLLN